MVSREAPTSETAPPALFATLPSERSKGFVDGARARKDVPEFRAAHVHGSGSLADVDRAAFESIVLQARHVREIQIGSDTELSLVVDRAAEARRRRIALRLRRGLHLETETGRN